MTVKTALSVKLTDFQDAMNGVEQNLVVTVDEAGNKFNSWVYFSNGMINFPTTLEDRATCETDASLLQLLPYILMVDQNTGKAFGYHRGKAGGESKLVGKMSMGVGGHVEEAVRTPTTDKPADEADLIHLLTEHAVREVVEEVGYTDSNAIHSQIFLQLSSGIPMVYQDTDPVGKFHLGLFLFVVVDRERFGQTEAGVIERGQWFDMPDPVLAEGDFFEGWTQVLIKLFKDAEVEGKKRRLAAMD